MSVLLQAGAQEDAAAGRAGHLRGLSSRLQLCHILEYLSGLPVGLPGAARGQWHRQCCCGHLIIRHYFQASLSSWSCAHVHAFETCSFVVASQFFLLSKYDLVHNEDKQPWIGSCSQYFIVKKSYADLQICQCSLFADSNFFGAAMGISESFLSLGWIVGPLLGGYAADIAGFAAPFILTGGLAFLATPVLYFMMPAGVPLALSSALDP